MTPRIVILGGSFAGAYCAQALERRLAPGQAEVLLLDRNNYFVFYPLLVEAGTGSLDPRQAVVSIRAFLRSARFQMARVTGVDLATRQVRFRGPEDPADRAVTYDHLVIALGSVTRLPAVPGLKEHGFELKTLADAIALRDRAIAHLELADACDDPARRRELLQFVVVGANFTGVELAGEFQVFLRDAARHYRRIRPEECQVTLLELADRILPALDPDLAEYAANHMRKQGMTIRLKTSVTAVEPHHAVLSDGSALPTRTVVWCAGIAPNPLLADLGLPTDQRGYLRCERDLRVTGHANVWAIGDCAVNTGPDGQPYPATAQHAIKEGQHCARSLVRVLVGQPTTPCDITAAGALAALGCRSAVAKVSGIKLSGFAAWWLWRTVYLLKMPGLARKLRIALEWTVQLFFPRDPIQLGLQRGTDNAERS